MLDDGLILLNLVILLNLGQKSEMRFTSCFSPLVPRAGEMISPESTALGRLSSLHVTLIETSDLPLILL